MKPQTNKILAMVALAILVASVLSGCVQRRSEGTTIRFVQMEYDNQVVPYLNEVAEKFMQENPDIKVEILSLDWEHGHDTYITWIKGNQAPDAANIAARWIAEFDELGALEPLDEYVSPELLEAIPDYYLKTGLYKGQRFGLPYFMDSRLVFYRPDLFEKAGIPEPTDSWTWEDFREAAIKTNDPANNIYGFVMMAGDVYFFDIFSTFLWSAGGDYWDADGNVAVNSPAGVEAISFLSELVNTDKVTQPGLTANSQFEVDKIFLSGNASMIYTGSWLATMIENENPTLPYKMVAFPVNQKAANIAAPDLLVMFKDSKNKEAVMKFIEFQYRDDIRKGFVQGRGIIPDTYSLMEDPELASPVWDAFQGVAPDSIPQPITPTTNRLMEEVMKMGQAVFLEQGTPQEEIDALAETMQSLSKP